MGYETSIKHKLERTSMQDDWQFQIVHTCSHFPHNFWSSCEYLIIIIIISKVKNLMLIKWSYKAPPILLIVEHIHST